MSLSSQNKKKKRKKEKKLKYGIGFSQFTNMKNIHKHEEHIPKKLIQIKSSKTTIERHMNMKNIGNL